MLTDCINHNNVGGLYYPKKVTTYLYSCREETFGFFVKICMKIFPSPFIEPDGTTKVSNFGNVHNITAISPLCKHAMICEF